MIFTEEDVPLMKLIFNPETHEMGMMLGRERAEEIFDYVCNETKRNKENFIRDVSDFFERILRTENFSDFFWDNNILQLSLLESRDIAYILIDSPIAEKILDSKKINLDNFVSGYIIYFILKNSPIAKKIWDSGKLDLSLLDKKTLQNFKQKFG